ncbi:MAG: hypothetical protein GXW90_10680 [Tepidanaerobacter acetatoxydans]|jgi:hypothetical protein|nr:hypothetical protein [Tepidanaerobacter acetatoxydans]AEE91024.1 protein of unknown function DUF324 [Tepidanaerobacter acetatoxydans Re1]NLU11375.1 hypothetical protein [Tepidanaerobacter acetatoxydans]
MSWQIYKIIFQVCSPVHVGWGKIGNLQLARPYLIGRVLWGALTMRLTRYMVKNGVAAQDSYQYQEVGKEVHRNLAFTYFYPALRKDNSYQIFWSWENEAAFRYRFLSSYAGTALSYPQQSASRGMLWETEFLSPNTIDTGEPVFLLGYIFAKEGCDLAWQKAMEHLQLGGERGYGWGDVKLISISENDGNTLFGQDIRFKEKEERPVVSLPDHARLLAHTIADGLDANGKIEPLVGRKWCSNQQNNSYAGQYIDFNNFCFVPGSIINKPTDFYIGNFGIWEKYNKLNRTYTVVNRL